MTLIYIAAGVLLFLFLVVFVNTHAVFHHEKDTHREPKLDEVFSPEAMPIEKKAGNKRAILFIHGFPSSPATYISAAEEVHPQGYDVYAPLLPGFGTTIDDFLTTNFTQWYGYLSRFYEEKRAQYDDFYIIGTSMGGALTLKLAEDYSSHETLAPTAVATAAAPVFLNSPISHRVVQNWGLYLIRTVGWFTKKMSNPRIIKDKEKDVDGDQIWRGYEGVFPRQTYSLMMGVREVRLGLPKITVPIALYHARGDKTVPYENMFHIAQGVRSDFIQTRTIEMGGVKHNHHMLFLYNSSRKAFLQDALSFFHQTEEMELPFPHEDEEKA